MGGAAVGCLPWLHPPTTTPCPCNLLTLASSSSPPSRTGIRWEQTPSPRWSAPAQVGVWDSGDTPPSSHPSSLASSPAHSSPALEPGTASHPSLPPAPSRLPQACWCCAAARACRPTSARPTCCSRCSGAPAVGGWGGGGCVAVACLQVGGRLSLVSTALLAQPAPCPACCPVQDHAEHRIPVLRRHRILACCLPVSPRAACVHMGKAAHLASFRSRPPRRPPSHVAPPNGLHCPPPGAGTCTPTAARCWR